MSYRIVAGLLTAIHLAAAPMAALAAEMTPQAGPGAGQIASRTQTIVVARVSDDPISNLPRLQAMADFLAQRMAGQGIVRGEALVVADNTQMIALLRLGKVDVVSESVLSALNFSEGAGADLLLREWKKGVASYRSVLITRKGSGIRDLADLRGKVVAVEDPGSTTGFLAPLAMLRARGIEAIEVLSGQRPPADKVGYLFTGGEVNVAVLVARGLADAGAFSNLDWDDLTRTPGPMKSALEVFLEGEPLLRSVLLVRGDLAANVKQALKDVLTGAHADPASAAALKEYYKVERYDEIAGEAADDLEHARALYAQVRDVL